MDSTAALQACALFKGLGEGALQQLVGISRQRTFGPGTPVFNEAATAESLLVIAQGTIRLSARDAAGTEAPAGELGAGESLGELSVLEPGKRQCSATAVGTVEVVELRHEDFARLMGVKPQPCLKLAIAIASQLGRRVAGGQELLRGLLSREPSKR